MLIAGVRDLSASGFFSLKQHSQEWAPFLVAIGAAMLVFFGVQAALSKPAGRL
jgi:threonine/homoserine/homoserine lactone efflux protein